MLSLPIGTGSVISAINMIRNILFSVRPPNGVAHNDCLFYALLLALIRLYMGQVIAKGLLPQVTTSGSGHVSSNLPKPRDVGIEDYQNRL